MGDDDDDDEDDDDDDEPTEEQDPPMFELLEHHLKLSRRKGFTLKSMATGNTHMIMGSVEGSILRCTTSTKKESAFEEIAIEPKVPITSVFINPSGNHVILSLDNGNTYYLHSSSSRPKKLVKAQGSRVTCVAWDRESGDAQTSGPILLGTESGAVFESMFEHGKEKVFRKIYQISNQGPIGGLVLEHWLESSTNDRRYFVMLSTSGTGRRPTRIFQFVGGPTLEQVFSAYLSPERLTFQELPGEIDRSVIQVYATSPHQRAKCFGVLTGEGVYYGNLVFAGNENSIVSGSGLLPFPNISTSMRKRGLNTNVPTTPLSMNITEYHVVLLYPKKVVVINKLSQIVALDYSFDSRTGQVEGVCLDSWINHVWIYSNRRIYELNIVDEDRDVWKWFMHRAKSQSGTTATSRDFDTALELCKTGDQRQTVLTAQADYFFDTREYDRAAEIYAKTRRSFEEVALRLIDANQRSALHVFLLQKLKCLHREDKTQRTVICTWLVELYLERLNSQSHSQTQNRAPESLLNEFKQFLEQSKRHLDPTTTFHILASHGRTELLVFFATLIEDYEKVVSYYVQRQEYDAALELLRGAPAPKVEEIFYKFSPELVQHRPNETIDAWKSTDGLEASRLIPAIVRCASSGFERDREDSTAISKASRKTAGSSRRGTDLAIEYLTHAVRHGDRDPTIHNYLLYLYAKHPDERRLIKFLRKKHDGKHLFDVAYALRLCTQEQKHRACIYIYSGMGLYEEAVEKSMQVDIHIAKEVAGQPEDPEMKKKLWIMIAKHTIDAGGDVREAMDILKESAECPDVELKIEDILPFFPDFAVINDFKSEISQSLESYSDRIDELKQEMKDYTESAEVIRSDMKTLRQRAVLISGGQRCDLSGGNILECEFYVFSCGHAFHAGALRTEVMKYLSAGQRAHVSDLVTRMNKLQSSDPSANLNNQTSERDVLQHQLDEIIASECIFCGEVMIQSITMPFVTTEEWANEGSDWVI